MYQSFFHIIHSVSYSITTQFYGITLSWEHTEYAPVLQHRKSKNTEQQNGCTKRSNFDFLFSFLGLTIKETNFLVWQVFGGHKEHLSGFAHVVSVFHILPMQSIWCRNAEGPDKTVGCILQTNQNTLEWNNSGIISPLFHGLTYNKHWHFSHCFYSSFTL